MTKAKRTSSIKTAPPAAKQTVSDNGSSELPSKLEIMPEIPIPARSTPAIISSAYPLFHPLHVLMVIDQLNVGGTETYTLSLTRELLRQGVKVVIASKRGKLLHPFIGLGCPVYELDFVMSNYEPNVDYYPELLNLLASIIEAEQIHLVHAHQFPSGILAKKAANDAHIPFVFTVHGTYYEPKMLDEIRESMVISVSPAVERMLLTNNISSRLIPNGVDVTEYQAFNPDYREHLRSKMGISPRAQVIVYASRLAWEKADICKELIHAVASLRKQGYPQLHLIIAGGGREEQEIIALANQMQQQVGQPFITFAGEALNMRSYYAVCDCAIGTGRIALEAMACMRPFIAIGSRGFLGAIYFANSSKAWDSWFGDHSITPEPFTREMLIDQIDCVLSMSIEDRVNLSRWGRRHIEERYPISNVAKKVMDAYEHALLTNKIAAHSV
ncbi:glycosyltransferase [Paenibacillus marinisediminis]